MLKYVLLGFLDGQPMTGYDLKSVMDSSTANFWYAHHSQIYTTLRQLEAEGMVTSFIEPQEDRPNKRIYEITAEGRTELNDWLAQPLTEVDHRKDALLVKLFFSSQRSKAELLAELYLHRKLHQATLAHYQGVTRQIIAQAAVHTERTQQDAPFWEMTRRCGELYEQAYIQWLDEVIAQLEA